MEDGFPKWKYHKSHAPKLAHNSAQEKEMGDDWAESPAKFEARAKKDLVGATSDSPVPSAEAVEAPKKVKAEKVKAVKKPKKSKAALEEKSE